MAPRTNSRFRSASTLTTVRPSSVWRAAPMWPGIRLPLMTRDGSVPGLIEPGFRWRVLPWVAGPPPNPWRCTTPWNPRPLVVPVTFTSSPAAKMSTFTSAPGARPSPLAAAKVRSTCGATSSPAFLAWPSSALVARDFRRAPKPSCTPPSRTCTTRQGPASITVTGTAVPSSWKTRVIPSFRPISPLVISRARLFDLDLDVHPGGQVELRQRIHRLRTRIVDVQEPLVRAQLELLPALLIDVRAPEHGPALGLDRQRDRARDLGPGLLGGAHDVRGGLIEHDVVESLEADANLLRHLNPLTVRRYFRILVTTPAPTVRPPSRIAKR